MLICSGGGGRFGALCSGFSLSFLDDEKAVKEKKIGGFIKATDETSALGFLKIHRQEAAAIAARTGGGDGH